MSEPTVNIHEAKTHLSRLLERVEAGEELEIKRALGKLEAPDGLVDAIEASALQALPISLEDAERAGRLPPHHRDPFDRMLVAQAVRLDAVIVSRDEAFAPYGPEVLRA